MELTIPTSRTAGPAGPVVERPSADTAQRNVQARGQVRAERSSTHDDERPDRERQSQRHLVIASLLRCADAPEP